MFGLLMFLLSIGQGTRAAAPVHAIAGTVLSHDGTPKAGVRITAIDGLDVENKGSQASIISLVFTDPKGRYLLDGLPPGRYYVLAGSFMTPSYFPGVQERSNATAVTVSRDKGADGIDFRLIDEVVQFSNLLKSDDPMNRAWGAWLAGESGKSELAPLIADQLFYYFDSGSGGRAAGIAVGNMADALIRFKATPRREQVELFYSRLPTEGLILLSQRGPEANEILLKGLDKSANGPWFATANLLLSNHAPGFVASLLRDLDLRAELPRNQMLSPSGN